MVQGREDTPIGATGGGRGNSAPVQMLGDFELRREIGRGGMGTVFEAWQNSLQRTVALKVLGSHISASPGAVGRFQREAQAAAKLQHPHIIPIYAQGEQHGVYYYAMELVEGKSLNAILTAARERRQANAETRNLAATIAVPRDGGAPIARTASGSESWRSGSGPALVNDESIGACSTADQFAFVCEQIANVADGLQYAHERGVVHRDIKPHNLMLGSDGRLRIADFGLARMSENPGVTVTGEMIGSPMYMSPEQITEGPSKVDARTDVYSLGVTLYEWITLRPPYDAETREQVISQIVSAQPVPPRVCNPSVPVDLETICLKAIERDKSKRYLSAAALRDDLRRFVSQQPIVARRLGPFGRAKRFLARHQVAAMLVFTGLVASVALLSTLALFRKQGQVRLQAEQLARITQSQSTSPRSGTETGSDIRPDDLPRGFRPPGGEGNSAVVIEERLRADEQRVAEADRIVDVLSSLLPELGLVMETARVASPVARGLVRGGEQLTNVMAGRPANPGQETAPVDGAGGESPEATLSTPSGIAKRALPDIYESLHPSDWPPNPAPGDILNTLLKSAVDVRQSNPQTAMSLLSNYLTQKPEDFQARLLRGGLAGQLGDFGQMAADGEELVTRNSANPYAFVWRGLAFLLLNQGEEGRRDLNRALEMNGNLLWARALLGIAFLETGLISEARSVLDDVLTRAPNLPVALFARATALAALGDFEGAVADITKALEMAPNDADALIVRGDYRNAMGDYSGALRDFDRAMKLGITTVALRLRWLAAMTQKKRMEGVLENRTPGTDEEELLYPVRGPSIRPMFPGPRNMPSRPQNAPQPRSVVPPPPPEEPGHSHPPTP